MNSIEAAFAFFGINFVTELNRARSFEQAKQIFEELQNRVKKQFKKRAKELHPDLNGSHEEMVQLTAAKDIVMKAELRPRARPVVIRFTRVFNGYDGSATYNDSYTSASSYTSATVGGFG